MTIIDAAARRAGRFGVVLTLAAGLAGAAQAAPNIQVQGAPGHGYTTQSRTMRFGDLDLSSEAGRARLETRLHVAAGTVCGKRSLWTVRPPADYTRCYDRAVSAARARLDDRLAAGATTIRVASN